MFTQPAPAPSPTGLASPARAATSPAPGSSTISPASPSSRTSRLRGLSYLRNYTQNHLLSREQHSTSPTSTSPPSTSNPISTTSQAARPSAHLSRSLSYSPTTTTTTTTTTTASNSVTSPSHRFSLVPTLSHPLGSSSAAERPNLTTSSISNANAPSVGRNPHSTSVGVTAAASDDTPGQPSMTRTRSATAGDAMAAVSTNGNNSNSNAAASTAHSNNANGNGTAAPLDILPSIRFSTFYDPRATRPSLTFTPVSRTLPTGSEVIRVGRYSERDSQPPVPVNVPSAAPVGFKSKVVSRRHCEFWYEAGKWYIRDVKSSSGTFLNHIRLSPPGTESKPFPVNDGDIVQLGIDFKGGEEMIFRCVKMRLELNRGWQNKLNTFNMTTHKRLRNMTKSNEKSEGAGQTYSQDCSICLNSIAPCQCLFVAPCSHTWHYKCIRSLLSSPQYPIFICPNCRAAADLEAEVEDPEEWEQVESEPEGQDGEIKANGEASSEPSTAPADNLQAPQVSAEGSVRKSIDRSRAASDKQKLPSDRSRASLERKRKTPTASPRPAPVDDDMMDVTMQMQLDDPPPVQPSRINTAVSTVSTSNTGASTPSTIDSVRQGPSSASHAISQPVPIPAAPGASALSSSRNTRTPSPNGGGSGHPGLNGTEGPITPRNDAGPWVFDGSGLRARGADGGITRMESLDGVAGAEIE